MTSHPFLRTIQTVLFDTRPALLTNSFFNNSQLKPRIQMLVSPQTSRRALWRYVFMLPVAALLLMCSQKDALDGEPPIKGEIFTVVEQNPEPKGGMIGLSDYLSNNLRYPAEAQKADIAGKVFIRFIVTAEGRISDAQILKGIGYGCDEEAVRVIKQMPDWIPGHQKGRAVNVQFNLPIAFTLKEVNRTTNPKAYTEADFLAQYNQFTIDGKDVNYATFKRASTMNVKAIKTDPAQHRISITTR